MDINELKSKGFDLYDQREKLRIKANLITQEEEKVNAQLIKILKQIQEVEAETKEEKKDS